MKWETRITQRHLLPWAWGFFLKGEAHIPKQLCTKPPLKSCLCKVRVCSGFFFSSLPRLIANNTSKALPFRLWEIYSLHLASFFFPPEGCNFTFFFFFASFFFFISLHNRLDKHQEGDFSLITQRTSFWGANSGLIIFFLFVCFTCQTKGEVEKGRCKRFGTLNKANMVLVCLLIVFFLLLWHFFRAMCCDSCVSLLRKTKNPKKQMLANVRLKRSFLRLRGLL